MENLLEKVIVNNFALLTLWSQRSCLGYVNYFCRVHWSNEIRGLQGILSK